MERLEPRALLTASVFSISDSQVVEGDIGTTGMVFTVTRYNDDGDYSAAESIYYFAGPSSMAGSIAAPGYQNEPSLGVFSDYVPHAGQLDFAPDQMSAEILITIFSDEVEEPDDHFVVRLSPTPEFASTNELLPIGLNYPHSVNEQITSVSFAEHVTAGVSAILVSAMDTTGGAPRGIVRALVNIGSHDGTPSFQSIGVLPAPSDSQSPILYTTSADFDGDGIGDILVANPDGVQIFRGLIGQSTSFAPGQLLAPLHEMSVSDVAIGDINHDGLVDVAIADRNGKLSFLINNSPAGGGTTSFGDTQDLSLPASPALVRLADLDGDQLLDVVAVYEAASDGEPTPLAIIRNISQNGSPTLSFESDQARVQMNSQTHSSFDVQLNQVIVDLELQDQDGDGLPDLVFSTRSQFGVMNVSYATLLNSTRPTEILSFDDQLTYYYQGLAKGFDLATGDLNHDGLLDAVQVSESSGGAFLYLRDTTGQRRLYPLGSPEMASGYRIAVGDLNQDNADDILLAHPDLGLFWYANTSNRTGLPGVSKNVGYGTIIDDDWIDTRPQVTLSVTRDTVYSNSADNVTIIEATLADGQPLAYALWIPIFIDPASTATLSPGANPDYLLSATTLVIPAGSTSGQVQLTALLASRGQPDPDETVILNVSSTPDFVIENTGPLTVTIIDPPEVQLLVGNNIAAEAGPNTFQIFAVSNKPLSEDTAFAVRFVEANSSASLNDLQFDQNATLWIMAGQTTGTLSITVIDDGTPEPAEHATFALEAVLQGHALFEADSFATVTLLDNDGYSEQNPTPLVRLSVSRTSVTAGGSDGQSTTRIRAELSNGQPLSQTLVIPLSTDPSSTASGPGSSAADYTISGLNIVIPAGSTFGEMTVTAAADGSGPPEPDETIVFRSTATSDFVLDTPAPLTVTIHSIPEIRLAMIQGTVREGDVEQIQLLVYANRPMVEDTDIVVVLDPGASTALESDFVSGGGALIRIPAGQTTATVAFTVAEDAIYELTEQATFIISGVFQGLARVAPNSRVVATIFDNDTQPVVNLRTVLSDGSFTSPDVSVAESNGSINVVAVLDAALPIDVTVSLTSSGTLGRAEFSTTYQGQTSSTGLPVLIIPAGATRSAVLRIQSVNDSVVEANESLNLAIAPSSAYLVGGRPPITVTILDDDSRPPQVTLQSTASTIFENDGVAGFQVKLDRPAESAVTVQLQFGGTASAADFTALSTVIIPAGETAGWAWVRATDDVLRELNETIIATVLSISGPAESGGGSATITILDDDAPVEVSVVEDSGEFSERADFGVMTISLSTATAYDVTVNLTFSGTAVLGTDYSAGFTSVTFAAGQLAATLVLTGIEDRFVEGWESLTVSIASINTGPQGRIVAVPSNTSSASLRIRDDVRPVLTQFGNNRIVVRENQTSAPATFRLFEHDGVSGTTVLTVLSSNPGLIAPANVAISYRASTSRAANRDNRQLTVTPFLNQFGTATITVQATNSAGTVQTTFEVTVTAENSAPQFLGNIDYYPLNLTPIQEDIPQSQNTGTSIRALLDGTADPQKGKQFTWFDPDGADSARGIAIIGADRSDGDWQYTMDGSTWKPIADLTYVFLDVRRNHALLLGADDADRVRIRYLPAANTYGTADLQFVAWDQTYGSTGSYVDLTALTGDPATAFGNQAFARIEIAAVNDQPVLSSGAYAVVLNAVLEQQGSEPVVSEYTVSQILLAINLAGGSAFDQETASPGIAFSWSNYASGDNLNPFGYWQYNSGQGWKYLNKNQFVLLANDSVNRLRYVGSDDPLANFQYNLNYSEATPLSRPGRLRPSIDVRAWDYSVGQAGDVVSVVAGSSLASALSTNSINISLPVMNVNDPPELVFQQGPSTYYDLDVGPRLYSKHGVTVESIFKAYYVQNILSVNYPPNGIIPNEYGVFSWRDMLDPDTSWENIGLAFVTGPNMRGLGTWEISYTAGDWTGYPLKVSSLARETFIPLSLGASIRFVPSFQGGVSELQPVSATLGIHDGGAYLATNYARSPIQSSPEHWLSQKSFRIFGFDSLTGTQAGNRSEPVTPNDVAAQARAAAEWWSAPAFAENPASALRAVQYIVSSLPDATLGLAALRSITLDADGAGIGWFIDPTPFDDEEYELTANGTWQAIAGSAADGKYDLLTVLAHEQGHLLGLPHARGIEDSSSVMAELLPPGVRRKPAPTDLDALFRLLADDFPEFSAESHPFVGQE